MSQTPIPPDPLHWVIVDGESEARSKVRSCDIGWVESIICQCRTAGAPVFVKQLGSRPVQTLRDGTAAACRYDNRKGADMDELPWALRVREFPRLDEPVGVAS